MDNCMTAFFRTRGGEEMITENNAGLLCEDVVGRKGAHESWEARGGVSKIEALVEEIK